MMCSCDNKTCELSYRIRICEDNVLRNIICLQCLKFEFKVKLLKTEVKRILSLPGFVTKEIEEENRGRNLIRMNYSRMKTISIFTVQHNSLIGTIYFNVM